MACCENSLGKVKMMMKKNTFYQFSPNSRRYRRGMWKIWKFMCKRIKGKKVKGKKVTLQIKGKKAADDIPPGSFTFYLFTFYLLKPDPGTWVVLHCFNVLVPLGRNNDAFAALERNLVTLVVGNLSLTLGC